MFDNHEISKDTAEKLIDFSGGQDSLKAIAESQLVGAVALQNMISKCGLAYLADEVGMGKTYVALGVVALMRFFNPKLKVLYVVPKNNVREKWVKEYKSFVKCNYRLSDGITRSLDGTSAVPFIECQSIVHLLRAKMTGQYGDFFICGSAFSFALNDEEKYLKEQIDFLVKNVPALKPKLLKLKKMNKDCVKEEYAKALNYILPTFDLVIVDEAHNFKNGLNSSDRNLMFSRILGVTGDGYQKRVRDVLLLSATPFDRSIEHLRNQLMIFGKESLLDGVTSDNYDLTLCRFMVRRLNEINFDNRKLTRNMYRSEHRSGDQAEIRLDSDEQRLFTALVQKKVGDILDRDFGGKYQTGMLASFESYLPSGTLKNAEFDGNQDELKPQEAPDRNVIEHLVTSFRENFEGKLPPHPKMDEVARRIYSDSFGGSGNKHLIFVRRVKSVPDLKAKFDELYDSWLRAYLVGHLGGNNSVGSIELAYQCYLQVARKTDRQVSEGEFKGINGGNEGEGDDQQPPQNDNFFTWFFRGDSPAEISDLIASQSLIFPEAIRRELTQKKSRWSMMFEFNWAKHLLDFSGDKVTPLHLSQMLENLPKPDGRNEPWRDFMACQVAFLKIMESGAFQSTALMAKDVLTNYFGNELDSLSQPSSELTVEKIQALLEQETFFSILAKPCFSDLALDIFPYIKKLETFKVSAGKEDSLRLLLRQLDIHRELLFTLIRIDHAFIDFYISRLIHKNEIDVLTHFISHLNKQKKGSFSSRHILSSLAGKGQLELILKVNFSDIHNMMRSELRRYIVKQISPLSPTIGASGETSSNRSSQARKFRMPGYPLILISTDVFQEGEDLHTFCDRVTHYGLSSSPIALEQKVGRVDRVHSLVHRNLLATTGEKFESKFIQVYYPYIRETMEYQQVWHVANNLNQFIKSLHTFSSVTTKPDDNNRINSTVNSPIPEQIKEYLTSPYVPEPRVEKDKSEVNYMNMCKRAIKKRQNHVVNMIESFKNRHKTLRIFFYQGNGNFDPNADIIIRLRSAFASGEMILSVSAIIKSESGILIIPDSGNELIKLLQKLEADPSYRLFAVETDRKRYQLIRNIEILVHDPENLQVEEVGNMVERINSNGNLPQIDCVSPQSSKDIFRKAQLWLVEHKEDYKNIVFKFNCREGTIRCSFHQGDVKRSQKISTVLYDKSYIVMTSVISDARSVRNLANNDIEFLIRATLIRNRQTDLVEFHIDHNGCLLGRISHPVEHLQPVEFLYCLQTLAAECDRLEYLICEDDQF